ncbi:MAG: helix-turn-helix domain-containing protein, partial [bacterium]|nr:helix-turn-helix domain-containing protein [bacterium]
MRLTAQEKLKLIKRVQSGEKLSLVCRQNHLSRTIFYRWLKQYKEAPIKTSRVLASWNPSGRKHWRKISQVKENQILKLALENPASSPAKLALKTNVSSFAIWQLLKRKGLNTEFLREDYLRRYGRKLIVTAGIRDKAAIMRRFESGEKVSYLCREFGISRTIFYRWLKRYQKAREGEREAALGVLRPEGEKHWRYKSGAKELVLKIVIEHPEFSVHKISEEAAKRWGRSVWSSYGVWSNLKKLNLNTYIQRLAFAQITVTPVGQTPVSSWLDRLKSVYETFVPTLAPAPPPALKSLGKVFAASFGSSTFLSLLLIFWSGIFAGQPFG